MTISDMPILASLRTRMQWHQERQRVLAENVANADTPSFRPRDLAPMKPAPSASGTLALARTSTSHLSLGGGTTQFAAARESKVEVRPAGNAVNLEDEMMKVAANQMDYQTVTTLYSRSMRLIRTALGRQG
jgi:flagellar basal-body rod protein FlgB